MITLALLAALQSPDLTEARLGDGVETAGPPAFSVGEHLRYAVKIGMLRVGTGTMSVTTLTTVRGVETYHFVFTLDGGVPGYRVHDRVESWTGREDLVTRRFSKSLREGRFALDQVFEIYPDSGHYLVNGEGPKPSPPDPLDETAFVYYLRSIPLEVGQTYVFHRYYQAEKNPLTINITKRERLTLPDGSKVDCLLLEPVMAGHDLMMRRVKAQVWLSDDHRRLPVRMRVKTPYGTLTFKLEAIRQLDTPATSN